MKAAVTKRQVDLGIERGQNKNNRPGSVSQGLESCTLFEVLQILIGLLSVGLGLLRRLVVGVVQFHEALPCPLLILLYLLLGVGAHVLMHLDVTRNAQQLAVGGIVCQSLHLLHGLGCLNGMDVVYVNAWRDEALGLA